MTTKNQFISYNYIGLKVTDALDNNISSSNWGNIVNLFFY